MIESADVVLLMVDGTEGTTPDTWALLSELGPERTILVWNKSDLATPPRTGMERRRPFRETGRHMPLFRPAREKAWKRWPKPFGSLRWPAARGRSRNRAKRYPTCGQARSLMEVLGELEALEQDVLAGVPYDLCAVRLEGAASALAEITGLDTPEEVLNRIFASFCIGK